MCSPYQMCIRDRIGDAHFLRLCPAQADVVDHMKARSFDDAHAAGSDYILPAFQLAAESDQAVFDACADGRCEGPAQAPVQLFFQSLVVHLKPPQDSVPAAGIFILSYQTGRKKSK